MNTYQNAKELNNLTLGKTTEYSSQYNANLLQGVPRSLNRDALALSANNLPFYGEDIWYGYELSWLNGKGKPVVAVAEFRFPCTNDNIVESKSFKLYLNSFNQTRFTSWQDVESTLVKDLSAITKGQCCVALFSVDNCPALAIKECNAVCIDELDIEIDNFILDPELLIPVTDKHTNKASTEIISEYLVCHLLKSNCLITNQPDWASVYIDYTGNKICHEGLLKYLISFREHNEFHEQCVERIFCDIQRFCQLEKLTVFARYTRRGGLDINPFRSTIKQKAPFLRTIRQ